MYWKILYSFFTIAKSRNGWCIPHPGWCISNPLENRINRDVLHTIRDVLYKYATPKALRSRKYGSQVPNLASRVATSQLKEPRVMPDLARVTRIFNCANNFWVGYLHCYIEDGQLFHKNSYSQTKTFVHFHSKYLNKIIRKNPQIKSLDRTSAEKKPCKLCCSNFQNRAVAKKRAVAVLKTVP